MHTIGDLMISVATVMLVVGFGLYISRYTARWSYRRDPGIMRWVEPMAKFGKALLAGLPVMAIGIALNLF